MIDSVTIELNGRKYEWSHDSEISSPDDCWSWNDVQTFMQPAVTIVTQLNRLFIDYVESLPEINLQHHEATKLHAILKSMGATSQDLEKPGLEFLVEATDPARFREMRFEASLPAPSHNPWNCPALRDWHFNESAVQVAAPSFVAVIGAGPFELQGFVTFLASRSVQRVEHPVGHLIVGREDWTEEELDVFIDLHRGRQLRVYSQEMFTQLLGSGLDPFAAGAEVLAAYRAGHPALEFISKGWRGWVSTVVPVETSTSTSRSGTASGWQNESPLHALGYKVGKQGISPQARKEILEEVFRRKLPNVGPRHYMEEWGEPGTSERLRKLANSLASNCRNMKRRRDRFDEAIHDWESDLDWLEKTFYRGHHMFQWPDTEV